MQTLAEKALEEHTERGAFVVMDCVTGDVYALASRPTYDINVWVPAITNSKFKELQEDPNLPLFPRAFRGQYPPASTFKISVALAALENGAVDESTLIDCPRSIQIGDKIFRNWSKKPEGNLNVMNAKKQFALQRCSGIHVKHLSRSFSNATRMLTANVNPMHAGVCQPHPLVQPIQRIQPSQ